MFRKLFRIFTLAADDSVFVIDLHNSRAELVKGNAPAGFASELTELVANAGIARGTIRGRRHQGHVRLLFSKDIPEETHQRIRNLWGIYEARLIG